MLKQVYGQVFNLFVFFKRIKPGYVRWNMLVEKRKKRIMRCCVESTPANNRISRFTPWSVSKLSITNESWKKCTTFTRSAVFNWAVFGIIANQQIINSAEISRFNVQFRALYPWLRVLIWSFVSQGKRITSILIFKPMKKKLRLTVLSFSNIFRPNCSYFVL